MPKIKTHKATKKRVKKSGSGKAQYQKSMNHQLGNKAKGAGKASRRTLSPSDSPKLKKLLPN